MKICYLCPDLGIPVDGQKGASSHIRGFVNALKNSGHEVTIATSCPVKEGAVGVPVSVIPQPELIDGILQEEDPRTFRALRHVLYNGAIGPLLDRIVAEENPDLIYERYSPFSFAGSVFARQRRIPHILEVNAPLAEQGKRFRRQSLQEASELLEKTALNQAGLIVTLTQELKDWLVSTGIPEEKIKVRPCGVDAELFAKEGASHKDEFGGKIVLGFVGSLKPWHDIELLCALFRRLSVDPRYHLLVVGDGPMRKAIFALSEDLPGRVTYTGAVEQDEVPRYIRAMDIALAPYPEMDLFYFSPLKVYEYMAMGRPLIATGIGQLNDLIDDGRNGCLVPPGDAKAWFRQIERLANNPALRNRMGEEAETDVRLKHTWKARTQTFEAIVEEYLQSHRAGLPTATEENVLQPL